MVDNHDMDDTNDPQDEHDCFCIRCCAIRLLSAITAAKREKGGRCPFCSLLHDPEKSNCNDPKTGALIRRRGPVEALGEKEADVSADDATRQKALSSRITEYLIAGGLFNPEMMEHDKVRDLLIDCRAFLDGTSVPSATPTLNAAGVSAEGEELPNETKSVGVEEWTVEKVEEWLCDDDPVQVIADNRNWDCATLRAEIAVLREALSRIENTGQSNGYIMQNIAATALKQKLGETK